VLAVSLGRAEKNPMDRLSGRFNFAEGGIVKSVIGMKKIKVRRTGDVRLTSAACSCPYHVQT
jgi:hypothetical protein